MPWHKFIKAPETLTRLNARYVLRDISLHWMVIFISVLLAAIFRSWWSYALMFAAVGIQMNVLANILHDGIHLRLHPSQKKNDLISQWLLAAPMMFPFKAGRANHLSHHWYLAQNIDPDRHWHISKNKHPAIKFIWFLIKCLTTIELVEMLLKYRELHKDELKKGSLITNVAMTFAPILLAQFMIFSIFTILFMNPFYYFSLFLLPIFTLFAFLNGFRSFTEHSDLNYDEEADAKGRLFTFVSNPLERYTIAPLNMNFHAEHHLNPSVPYYNLSRFRKYLQNADLDDQFSYRQGYVRYAIEFFNWSNEKHETNQAVGKIIMPRSIKS